MEDSKSALRAEADRRRARLSAELGVAAARRLAARFVNALELSADQVVALYWPIRSELDTRPLMEMLTARGVGVALPVVVGPARPLVFRRWRPGLPLVDGHFGIRVPPETAQVVRPDVLGVPLLAFDDQGHRLGYGGGFYDRTLEALRADGKPAPLAAGLAFERQRVGWLPAHDGDQRLDVVVTDHDVHWTGKDDR
ncbi:MAG: 5-formyltetrahydrofolate cyclo-ligase [Alphaproteobacteria bacterium]|nr:MAG: 5-formyltetrahydrofolate cyclo-ligase [Alphaproteobacteria bacterium]